MNLIESFFMKQYRNWIVRYGATNTQIYIRTNPDESKYYVGYSNNYNKRYRIGYKPNYFQEVYNINTWKYIFPVPENLTIEEAELYIYSAVATLYGEDNVRGAHRTRYNLCRSRNGIQRQLEHHLHNKCYRCGKSGHYARHCRY